MRDRFKNAVLISQWSRFYCAQKDLHYILTTKTYGFCRGQILNENYFYFYTKKKKKILEFSISETYKAITSVRRPKMKRDAGVKAVFFFSKKTAFSPPSLFFWGWRTDVTVLAVRFFFLCSPDCPEQPRIGNSNWKCVTRHICSLICEYFVGSFADLFLAKTMNFSGYYRHADSKFSSLILPPLCQWDKLCSESILIDRWDASPPHSFRI